MTPDDLIESLPRDELRRILLAVRSVARASGPLHFKHVLASVLAAVRDVLAPDRMAIYLLDEARARLVMAGADPPTPTMEARYPEIDLAGTITGRIVAAREPVGRSVGDLGLAGATLAKLGIAFVGIVPLYVQDRASGVLHLGRKDRAFDDHELRMAQSLGEFLIVYLENARLYTDAHGRLEETAMLLDVARSVNMSLDLEARLAASVDAFARLVDAPHAFIVLIEGGTELVMAQSDPRWTADLRGQRFRLDGDSAAALSIRERRAVPVEDATTSPDVALVERFGIKSLLALPLMVGGEPIGAIVAIETRHTRSWGAAQVQRGEVIAHQIAVAIAHARLYDEVKKSYAELARTQAELVKRERLAALGQLAATLAHEVRNPLAVIFNSIATLGKTLPSDDAPTTLLQIMAEEANRLDRLVRELLDFVRPVMATLEDESLHAIVDETLEAAQRELGPESATLSNDVSKALPLVPLDAGMLRRALLNLVVNGAQAAGSEGTVVIRASVDGMLRIDVSDTGNGIAQEVAPRIFEPFFTTKATGTGLGLAIVKEIVEAHRGEVRLTTKVGQGTTITLLLPIDQSETSTSDVPIVR